MDNNVSKFQQHNLNCIQWMTKCDHMTIVVTRIVNIHYSDVIMGPMACQITSHTIVYSTFYSGADQRKHQSAASLAFVCGEFTGDQWIPHTKGQ